MLAQILSRWVFSMEDHGDFSGSALAHQARRPLDKMRTGAITFLRAYIAAKEIAPQDVLDFLTRVGRYAGARMVHIALEAAQPFPAATAPVLLHAQLGLNIMSRPYEAAVQLLGLAPDAVV